MAHEGERFGQWIGRRLRVGRIGIAATAKLGRECLGLRIHQFEVHRGIVGTGSLVDVDIQSIVALHLQRGLHTCR